MTLGQIRNYLISSEIYIMGDSISRKELGEKDNSYDNYEIEYIEAIMDSDMCEGALNIGLLEEIEKND